MNYLVNMNRSLDVLNFNHILMNRAPLRIVFRGVMIYHSFHNQQNNLHALKSSDRYLYALCF